MLTVGDERDHFGYDPVHNKKVKYSDEEHNVGDVVSSIVMFGAMIAMAVIIIIAL